MKLGHTEEKANQVFCDGKVCRLRSTDPTPMLTVLSFPACLFQDTLSCYFQVMLTVYDYQMHRWALKESLAINSTPIMIRLPKKIYLVCAY